MAYDTPAVNTSLVKPAPQHQGFGGEGEPGDDPKAPYYHEHQLASGIEQILANELGVSWLHYEATVDAL